MPSYYKFDFDHDPNALLTLFNDFSKTTFNNFNRIKADLPTGICESDLMKPFFDAFYFIPKYDLSIEILQLTGNTRPHINSGNNGLIIFPIQGTILLNNYSYVTPFTDENYRPVMDHLNMGEEEILAIESTKIESVVIDRPTLIDGLKTLSFHPNSSNPIVLALKVNKIIEWYEVYNFTKKYF
jgi:hypothetical protein